MDSESKVIAAEHAFFDALVRGDAGVLEPMLDPAFTMVGINGAVITREQLIGAIAAGILVFDHIDPVETTVRFHGPAAVVVGRTTMGGRMGDQAFTAASRYTHVYLEKDGGYRFVAAQGTPIVG